ncbi:MFS transporter [Rhodococcus opacus]|nr:MFS transporter [Rhodococcus opacus]
MSDVPSSAWSVPGFRNLWTAQSISLIGTQVTLLAFPVVALTLLDASALQVSLLAAVEFLPVLLFGLPAGAWVDRLPRRPVLIATDVVRAVALSAVPIAYLFGVLDMTVLFVVAFLIGLGTLFFDVAQLSYLPALVAEEQLVDANGKLEVSRSVSQLAGPSAAGFLVQLVSGPIAIALDALSYVASTVSFCGSPETCTTRNRSNPSVCARRSGRDCGLCSPTA